MEKILKSFDDFGLPSDLLLNLKNMGFKTPTPVQSQAIPVIMDGRDTLVSAQTGTGKTAAFGIPLITKLIEKTIGRALIILPTRELATQVANQLKLMLVGKKNKPALLIGGESIYKQINQLRRSPSLIVGTPGRINDHVNKEHLKLNNVNFLVLDEVDKMLDMGFSVQIDDILSFVPNTRQTVLFSATMPDNIVKLSNKYLTDAIRIDAHQEQSSLDIDQQTYETKRVDKYSKLISELYEREGSIIVFMRTKRSTEEIACKLNADGFNANAIHGDLKQSKRNNVISSFRNKKYKILVATDVASRGLDIPHIKHVVNYDLPDSPEDYVHRIGRTARAGAKGHVLNMISPYDLDRWDSICNLMKIDNLFAKNSLRSNSKKKNSFFNHRRSKFKNNNFKSSNFSYKFTENRSRSAAFESMKRKAYNS